MHECVFIVGRLYAAACESYRAPCDIYGSRASRWTHTCAQHVERASRASLIQFRHIRRHNLTFGTHDAMPEFQEPAGGEIDSRLRKYSSIRGSTDRYWNPAIKLMIARRHSISARGCSLKVCEEKEVRYYRRWGIKGPGFSYVEDGQICSLYAKETEQDGQTGRERERESEEINLTNYGCRYGKETLSTLCAANSGGRIVPHPKCTMLFHSWDVEPENGTTMFVVLLRRRDGWFNSAPCLGFAARTSFHLRALWLILSEWIFSWRRGEKRRE